MSKPLSALVVVDVPEMAEEDEESTSLKQQLLNSVVVGKAVTKILNKTPLQRAQESPTMDQCYKKLHLKLNLFCHFKFHFLLKTCQAGSERRIKRAK